MEERSLTKEAVSECLFGNNLLKSEIQKVSFKGHVENRYKLTYKLSSKYYLLVIISYGEKILNVINIIKTSKNLEKKWRKKISG